MSITHETGPGILSEIIDRILDSIIAIEPAERISLVTTEFANAENRVVVVAYETYQDYSTAVSLKEVAAPALAERTNANPQTTSRTRECA